METGHPVAVCFQKQLTRSDANGESRDLGWRRESMASVKLRALAPVEGGSEMWSKTRRNSPFCHGLINTPTHGRSFGFVSCQICTMPCLSRRIQQRPSTKLKALAPLLHLTARCRKKGKVHGTVVCVASANVFRSVDFRRSRTESEL